MDALYGEGKRKRIVLRSGNAESVLVISVSP